MKKLFFLCLILVSTSLFAQRNYIYTFDGLQVTVPSTFSVTKTSEGGLMIKDSYNGYEMEVSAILASTLNSLVNTLASDFLDTPGSSSQIRTDDYFSLLPDLMYEVKQEDSRFRSFSLIERRASGTWGLVDYSCFDKNQYCYVKGRYYILKYGSYIVEFDMIYPYDSSVSPLQRIANSLKRDSSIY